MFLKFHTLDVFTAQRFGGNPLAVVHGADALDDAQMQKIAREFNVSETVFILAPQESSHCARVRIFTPVSELPFAGHPTVGTACLLAEMEALKDSDKERERVLVLEEGVGNVACAVTLSPNQPTKAVFTLPKLPVPHDEMPSLEQIATAHGLGANDIGFDNHVPSGFDAGLPYLMVPVRHAERLASVKLNTAAWNEVFSSNTTGSSFLYCRECQDVGSAFHSRMFAPDAGIPEDPATGSAVASFAGSIMRFEKPENGEHTYQIEQGYEMGRPSLIDLHLVVAEGKLQSARIGGSAVRVMEGTLST